MINPSADRILKNARIHLPGALDDALKLELYNVAREFCDGSDVWREDVVVKVVADRSRYEIVTSAEPARLLALLDKNGAPVAASMAEPGVLLLRYTPNVSDQYVATVSLLPLQEDSTSLPILPEWISRKYYQDLTDGVIARMMAHPAKPYSNPTLAVYHMRKFRGGIATAKAHAAHTNLYDGQAWRFPAMGVGRRQ